MRPAMISLRTCSTWAFIASVRTGAPATLTPPERMAEIAEILARGYQRLILAECKARIGDQVSPEFLRSQIEVGTKVCTSIAEATEELRALISIIRVWRLQGDP